MPMPDQRTPGALPGLLGIKQEKDLKTMEMRGGIYTKEKCPECGRNFKDNGFSGMQCQEHPAHHAQKNFQVRFLRNIHRQFTSYEKAFRFLNGLRYEVDTNKFDELGYQERGRPLAKVGMPEFPQVRVKLGWRKTISRNIQNDILQGNSWRSLRKRLNWIWHGYGSTIPKMVKQSIYIFCLKTFHCLRNFRW